MNRSLASLVAASIALCLGDLSWGQVVAYDHHSTAHGDYLAGAAEVVLAQGKYAKDVATAAETWTRVDAARDTIEYQRAEYRHQARRMDLQYRQEKLDARKTRNELRTADRLAAARRLWAESQQGYPRWPQAMMRAEFSSSVSVVESLLRNWSPEASPLGDAYRRSLVTEIGVLRNRINAHPELDFSSRADAIRTLNNLELLASTETISESAHSLAMK